MTVVSLMPWLRRRLLQPAALTRALRQDGYVVLRGVFGHDAARRMHVELSGALAQAKGPLHRYGNGALAISQRTDIASETIAAYLGDPLIARVVEDYFAEFSDRAPMVNEQVELERNVTTGTTNNSEWHFDRTPSVKAAIFLTDTDASNGAMYVVPGSHKAARRTALRFFERNPDPVLVDNFVKLGSEPVVRLDFKAGDVVIFDTFLVHKGGEMAVGKERAVIRGVTWPPRLDRRYLDGGDGPTLEVSHPHDRTGQKCENPRHMFQDDDAAALFARGVAAMRADYQQVSRHAEAQRYFEAAIRADPNHAEAHFHLGLALQVQTRHVEGIPHYQRALELDPGMTKARYELARALHQAERFDEAQAELEAVLRLEPDHKAARGDLDDLLAATRQDQLKAVRYPNRQVELADLKAAVTKHLLGGSYPAVLSAKARVATFGSCFAANIARALRDRGIAATNTTFGEFVNSTPANRHYVDWIVDGAENSVTAAIAAYHAGDPNFSGDPAEHRARIGAADLIVLTMGVAPCFFRRDTGALVIPRPSEFNLRAVLGQCDFRTTTVQENADNIRHMLRQLRRINPGATVAVTLSPVPLKLTFEYESAVAADCVSKSTLRVAVDEVLRDKPANLVYWPSFEIVRWLGSYRPGMYGAEDGSTFHVSEAVVQLIVDLFIERLSAAA